jgi:ACS family hexuronate transporter-like MFS transporter
MIGLIMLGSIINYLTRSTPSVAAPIMLRNLHITERHYSWITGAFQGTIMLQPICGYVLERGRPENRLRPIRRGVVVCEHGA